LNAEQSIEEIGIGLSSSLFQQYLYKNYKLIHERCVTSGGL